MNEIAKCKCGAEIIWARTKRGSRMPLNAKALTAFTLRVDPDEETPHALGARVHISHFATCPLADDFRRSGS